MFKKIIVLLVVSVMVFGLLAGCAPKQPAAPGPEKSTGTLKISMSTNEHSTWFKGAEKFKNIVEEKTEGRMKVQLFPNEQLSGGNQPKGIEMVQSGATEMSLHSNIIYSVLDQRFGVISLPWLLPDFASVDKALNGPAGEELFKIVREKGIEPLAFGENGFRQLTNNKLPVQKPADMKGLKIRIPGIKMYTDLYQALGADPTVMNFAEVFTSLQQGAIDGQENPIPVIVSARLAEVQKYLTIWNYSYDALIFGINKDLFDGFDKETQQIIRDAAKEAMAFQIKINREDAVSKIDDLKKAGMEVNILDDAAVKEFQEVVKPVYTMYEPIVGKALLDAFRK